jgi:hypothetical protein
MLGLGMPYFSAVKQAFILSSRQNIEKQGQIESVYTEKKVLTSH